MTKAAKPEARKDSTKAAQKKDPSELADSHLDEVAGGTVFKGEITGVEAAFKAPITLRHGD